MSSFTAYIPAVMLLAFCGSGAAFGQTTMTASPSSVTFSYLAGSATPVSQTIQVTSTANTTYTVSFSPGTLAYYVSAPTSGSTNSSITFTLEYPNYFSSTVTGSVTLTPADTTVNALTIPVVLSPYTSASLTASPSSLAYSYTTGSTTAITQYVTVTSTSTVTLTPSLTSNLSSYFSIPSTATSNSQFAVTLTSPQSITTTTTGSLVLTPPSGSGLSALTIPITVTPTAASTTAITASPSSLTFSFASGSTTAVTQYVQLAAPSSAAVTLTLSSELAFYFTVPSSATSTSQIAVTMAYPQYFASSTSGTLTVTPASGSGLSALVIPITVTPTSTSTTTLTASPSSLTYSVTSSTTAAIAQYLQITSASAVTLTPTLSSNLSPYFTIPSSVTTNTQFAVTLASPAYLIGGATGYLTLTPPSGSGIAAISVPIYVNQSGTSTGTIIATPSSLTFTGALNGTAPAAQTITLTAADNSSQFISANVTSTSNFLNVTQTSFTTPSTLTVRVDPTVLSATGTYTGTITVQLASGTTAATIPVAFNLTSAVTVTPSPTSVTLTAAAGSATAVSSSVLLSTTNSTLAYTATTAVTSGAGWLTVTPASGTLGTSIAVTANAASLGTGTYSGTVTITSQGVTVATIPVTFTVTTAAAIQLSSTSLTFDYQTGTASLPASQPVTVTSSGSSLNWTATASSTGGWLQVTPASGSTGFAFNVSVVPSSLAAGVYTGTVSVASSSANNSPQTVSVKLNVTATATPVISSVLNAASLTPTSASPGEIITIRGTNLGPITGVNGTVDSLGSVSTTLSGTQVLFDGTAAPLLYVSATQINAIAPYEIANRVSTNVQVTSSSQSSQALGIRVAATSPGLFSASSSGSGQGSVLNQDGSINSAANPERRGNVVVLYGTGLGQTTPAGVTGVISGSMLRTPTTTYTVWIGGIQAEVLYIGSAPGLVSGAMQINARIPTSAGTGSLPVQVQLGDASSQSALTVAVQ